MARTSQRDLGQWRGSERGRQAHRVDPIERHPQLVADAGRDPSLPEEVVDREHARRLQHPPHVLERLQGEEIAFQPQVRVARTAARASRSGRRSPGRRSRAWPRGGSCGHRSDTPGRADPGTAGRGGVARRVFWMTGSISTASIWASAGTQRSARATSLPLPAPMIRTRLNSGHAGVPSGFFRSRWNRYGSAYGATVGSLSGSITWWLIRLVLMIRCTGW